MDYQNLGLEKRVVGTVVSGYLAWGRHMMKYLTKEQQKVLCVLLLILLTGLTVKVWRTMNPPKADAIVAK